MNRNRRNRKRNAISHSISCVLCCLAIVCGLKSANAQEAPTTRFGAARALESAMVESIGKAEQSVVAIARGKVGEGEKLREANFVPYEYSAGVVVGKAGLILTNYHSLGDVNKSDYVVWHENKSYSRVVVKAADPWTDLAVLEISARDLKPIEFGDAANLKKGRIVIALGNPHAIARDGNVSATWGIVSNTRRKIDGPLQENKVSQADRETRYHFGGLIQTDAKLARGTSGGPLLDLDGKMVGLSTSLAMMAGFEKGTGYAIPVDEHFLRTLERLKRGEAIEQGFLGVAPRDPNPYSDERGAVLERVQSGTPAAKDGLFARDQVIRIDGEPVKNIDDLFLHIGSKPPGHVAKIDVVRFGKTKTVPVRLTKKPTMASRPAVVTAEVPQWRGLSVDYSTALSTLRLAAIDPKGCVVVSEVKRDSLSWAAGLRVGTMISELNGKRVSTPAEFHEIATKLSGEVRIAIYDRDQPQIVKVGE